MSNSKEDDNGILSSINWLPGHMVKATREIKKTIDLVDIIIEVRDARLPLVSGNKDLYLSKTQKPYLIVFNKTNLASPESVKLWSSWLSDQNESFIFINAMEKASIKQIVKSARSVVQCHKESSGASDCSVKEIRMMILGLPNTGKSTIINKLSNRNATKAAATPGQTTAKLWVKADKDLNILDTPGVMPLKLDQEVHAMWLSAIHAIPDHIITPDYSACFIIEHLLYNDSKALESLYKFETTPIDLICTLDHIAKRRGCLISGGSYDYERVYKIVLDDFRKGLLGLTSFESPPKSP